MRDAWEMQRVGSDGCAFDIRSNNRVAASTSSFVPSGKRRRALCAQLEGLDADDDAEDFDDAPDASLTLRRVLLQGAAARAPGSSRQRRQRARRTPTSRQFALAARVSEARVGVAMRGSGNVGKGRRASRSFVRTRRNKSIFDATAARVPMRAASAADDADAARPERQRHRRISQQPYHRRSVRRPRGGAPGPSSGPDIVLRQQLRTRSVRPLAR